MVVEMVEKEPPLFSEAPLVAMRHIRDSQPPALRQPNASSALLQDFLSHVSTASSSNRRKGD